MRLISWNVNGIRSALKKGLLDFIAHSDADAICLQEVRATPDQVPLDLPGYRVFWNPAQRAGYSGTAVLTRVEPLNVFRGMDGFFEDLEGRVLTLEFDTFFLVNVYTPNSGEDLARLRYRHDEWDPAFLAYCRNLERTRPVVFCGDLNVAHQEIDLRNPKANVGNAGFTPEEREGFDRLVAAGFVDTFRHFCSEGDHYTWWSYRGKARDRNVGWRIDYFCVSPQLLPRVQAAEILDTVTGSDHCPVALTLS